MRPHPRCPFANPGAAGTEAPPQSGRAIGRAIGRVIGKAAKPNGG
jgi:hypothetical protein